MQCTSRCSYLYTLIDWLTALRHISTLPHACIRSPTYGAIWCIRNTFSKLYASYLSTNPPSMSLIIIGNVEKSDRIKRVWIKDDTMIACWRSWCNDGVRWHEKTGVGDFGKLSRYTNEEKLRFGRTTWRKVGINPLRNTINCGQQMWNCGGESRDEQRN